MASEKDSENDSGRSGRWSKAEHELFLVGLREHGRDWKKIGALIPTRSVVQVRTHAQKFFLANKKQELASTNGSLGLEMTHDSEASISTKTKTKPSSPPSSKAIKTKKKPSPNVAPSNSKNQTKVDDLMFLEVLDAWSSGSDDTGSPTALDDDSFKVLTPLAPLSPLSSHQAGPTVPQTDLAADVVDFKFDLGLLIPGSQTKHLPNSTNQASIPLGMSPTPFPQTTSLQQPLPHQHQYHPAPSAHHQQNEYDFDPLPPSWSDTEGGFLGKWIEQL